jgi:predicted HicB family RNase H-like nuclease
MSKDRSIFVRVDAEQAERMKAAADRERRSLAQWARNVLDDAAAKPQEQSHAA